MLFGLELICSGLRAATLCMRALSSAGNQDTAESLLQTVHAFQRQEEKTTIDSEKFYKNWNFKAKRDFLTLSNKVKVQAHKTNS